PSRPPAPRPVPTRRSSDLRLRVRLPDLAPRDCLVVEDSQPGLEGARRAGMRCLAVTNSYPAAELAGADLIVSSLAEAGWDRLAADRKSTRLNSRHEWTSYA